MNGVFQVALALVLGLGWGWSELLADSGLISKETKFLLVGIVTLVFALHQVFIALPKPVNRTDVENQKRIVELWLAHLLKDYYETLQRVHPAEDVPIVRANLALPTWGFLLVRSHLQLYYFWCPSGVVYTNAELELKWRKKVGAVGSAWNSRNNTLYDSVDPRFTDPAKRIGVRSARVVANVRSVLSVPLLKDGRVVGVLNLDSDSNIDTTRFDNQEIAGLVRRYADDLRPLCFSDGVR